MKMNKVLKGISILLCIILAFGLLSGCKNDNGKEVQQTENNSSETETAEVTEAKDPFGKYEPGITVSVVRALGDDVKFEPGNPERESLEKNIWASVYEEELGITLDYKWTVPIDQITNKWNLAIASKDFPDMGLVPLDIFILLAEADLLMDMTPYFEDYASPLYKEAMEKDGGVAMSYNTYNGKLVGVPVPGSQPDATPMLIVRKDWLDNVGLEIPKTMEEFYEVAKAFRENDPDQNGVKDTWGYAASNNLGPAGVCGSAGFFNGFNAYIDIWTEKDGKLVYGTVQPEVKEGLAMLQKMYAEKLIATDFATMGPWQVADKIVSEEVGMYYGIFWAPLVKLLDNVIANPKAEWVVVPNPSVDSQPAKSQTGSGVQSTFVVFKDAENPEAMIKLINKNLEKALEDPQKYGTQEDGFNVAKFRIPTEMNMPWKNLEAHYAVKEAFLTGDTSKFNKEQQNTYEYIQALKDGDRTQYSQNLVFGENGTFSIVDYYLQNDLIVIDKLMRAPTDTMVEKMSSLKSMLSETYLKIIMGDSLDKFDEAVADWYKRGGDVMTEEINEWYKGNQ